MLYNGVIPKQEYHSIPVLSKQPWVTILDLQTGVQTLRLTANYRVHCIEWEWIFFLLLKDLFELKESLQLCPIKIQMSCNIFCIIRILTGSPCNHNLQCSELNIMMTKTFLFCIAVITSCLIPKLNELGNNSIHVWKRRASSFHYIPCHVFEKEWRMSVDTI